MHTINITQGKWPCILIHKVPGGGSDNGKFTQLTKGKNEILTWAVCAFEFLKEI